MTEDGISDLRAVANLHPDVDLYIFGSTIHGLHPPIDLDVLAVYTTLEGFDAFRADLDRQAFAPLIDLVAMTPDELRGSGFLDRSCAVPLADVGARIAAMPTASSLGRLRSPDLSDRSLASGEESRAGQAL